MQPCFAVWLLLTQTLHLVVEPQQTKSDKYQDAKLFDRRLSGRLGVQLAAMSRLSLTPRIMAPGTAASGGTV